jgi:hypothetical protein
MIKGAARPPFHIGSGNKLQTAALLHGSFFTRNPVFDAGFVGHLP